MRRITLALAILLGLGLVLAGSQPALAGGKDSVETGFKEELGAIGARTVVGLGLGLFNEVAGGGVGYNGMYAYPSRGYYRSDPYDRGRDYGHSYRRDDGPPYGRAYGHYRHEQEPYRSRYSYRESRYGHHHHDDDHCCYCSDGPRYRPHESYRHDDRDGYYEERYERHETSYRY